MLAMSILCTTSQVNLHALNLVQSLAAGCQTHSKTTLQSSHPSCPAMEHIPDKPRKAGSRAESKSRPRPPPPLFKGTRFLLPSSHGGSNLVSNKAAPPSQSTVTNVATLNVLGMQPNFNVVDTESVYTADQSVMSYQTMEEQECDLQRLTKAASADDVIKFTQNRFPRLLPVRQTEASDYRTLLNSTLTASSMGTQSLIANESIPDALPSMEFSNATLLGSITTLDVVESLEKSAGLFNCSTSKNLDPSVSNLVSPCVVPSGDLDLELAGRSVESSSESSKLLSVANVIESGIEERSECDEDVKKVEASLEGKDRVHLFDEESKAATHPVQPQHVKLVIAPISEPESRCTHYTHSTAPLADGANMLGSQVHPSTVLGLSMLSTDSSPSSQPSKKLAQFECWPGEVALTYTICMASIAIYGKTSLIQQTALEGPRGEGLASSKGEEGIVSRNFGLLELAKFGAGDLNEEIEEKKQGM